MYLDVKIFYLKTLVNGLSKDFHLNQKLRRASAGALRAKLRRDKRGHRIMAICEMVLAAFPAFGSAIAGAASIKGAVDT